MERMIVSCLRNAVRLPGRRGTARIIPRNLFRGGALIRRSDVRLQSSIWSVAMAIYHFSVKVIGRAAGRSAVAAAAYRSASRLRDDRLDRDHDFSAKRGVVHSEVMLPENAPEVMARPRTAVERCRSVRDAEGRPALPARWSSPFRAR